MTTISKQIATLETVKLLFEDGSERRAALQDAITSLRVLLMLSTSISSAVVVGGNQPAEDWAEDCLHDR